MRGIRKVGGFDATNMVSINVLEVAVHAVDPDAQAGGRRGGSPTITRRADL